MTLLIIAIVLAAIGVVMYAFDQGGKAALILFMIGVLGIIVIKLLL